MKKTVTSYGNTGVFMSRIVLLSLWVIAAGCETTLDAGNGCNAQTCQGCCSYDGKCMVGREDNSCGSQGVLCVNCVSLNQSCLSQGVCSGATGQRVFMTSSLFDGNFKQFNNNVLAAADSLCMAAAQSINLPGTYKAFVSTQSTGAIDRIVGNGPWLNMAGKVAFNNKSGLLVGPLAALTYDERGRDLKAISTELRAWTGSGVNGRVSENCNDWTSSNTLAPWGNGDATDSSWMAHDNSLAGCSSKFRLYCFEQ